MNPQHTLIFYDGHCGLCHRAVRFALLRDPDGSLFRFAPLQGETVSRTLSVETITNLPDSIVVLQPDGKTLYESEAILSILDRIGGGWRLLSTAGSWVPQRLRDLGYRGIAQVRHRLFKRPPEVCPRVPQALMSRFLP